MPCPHWPIQTLFTCFLLVASLRPALADTLFLPAGKAWVLSHDEEKCRLIGQFGDGKNATILMMDQFGPGDDFALTIAGEPVRRRNVRGEAVLQFGEQELPQEREYFSGDVNGRPALIFRKQMRIGAPNEYDEAGVRDMDERGMPLHRRNPVSAEREAAVKFLDLEVARGRHVRLETGPMGPVFAAIDKCVDNMVRYWGYDPDQRAQMTREAAPIDVRNWSRGLDYPDAKWHRGQQAIIKVRLSVDEAGETVGCRIQGGTDPDGFDAAVCDHLRRRARFEPALDADGKAMPSFFLTTVIFTMNR